MVIENRNCYTDYKWLYRKIGGNVYLLEVQGLMSEMIFMQKQAF